MSGRKRSWRWRCFWWAVGIADLLILYVLLWPLVSARDSIAYYETVMSLQMSHAPQARVVQVLGQPEVRFGPGDFLHGFPLPGYHYHRHPVTGQVWVYPGHSGRQPSKTYVYFDPQGQVEWTQKVSR